MTKHILFPIALVIAFILIVGLYLNKSGFTSPTTPSKTAEPLSKKEIVVSGRTLQVEIADNQEKRTNGLSKRNILGPNEGMLFIFESKDIYPSFWMKDMTFPIDIIWINDDKITDINRVVDIQANVPDSKLKLYSPAKPVDYVLEVNAGFCTKYGIKVGDSVDLSQI